MKQEDYDIILGAIQASDATTLFDAIDTLFQNLTHDKESIKSYRDIMLIKEKLEEQYANFYANGMLDFWSTATAELSNFAASLAKDKANSPLIKAEAADIIKDVKLAITNNDFNTVSIVSSIELAEEIVKQGGYNAVTQMIDASDPKSFEHLNKAYAKEYAKQVITEAKAGTTIDIMNDQQIHNPLVAEEIVRQGGATAVIFANSGFYDGNNPLLAYFMQHAATESINAAKAGEKTTVRSWEHAVAISQQGGANSVVHALSDYKTNAFTGYLLQEAAAEVVHTAINTKQPITISSEQVAAEIISSTVLGPLAKANHGTIAPVPATDSAKFFIQAAIKLNAIANEHDFNGLMSIAGQQEKTAILHHYKNNVGGALSKETQRQHAFAIIDAKSEELSKSLLTDKEVKSNPNLGAYWLKSTGLR
ncbi:MAG: hypothetical protein ABSA84_04175 [Gammaproteobacteria bacterium]